ncbi:MAG: isoprenylcysteine carboxylmethyltransferase family protein [Nocardiopsaceae bacterium]|nr:isoprenylcysteine carboxylmethyltransferase family protein [Nocardiopsaceae bacterium]
MALTAFVLYLLGLTLAFGVRTLVAWRRTGDTGFRRPETRPGSPAWWGAVLFVGALLLGLAAPVAALTGLPTASAESHPAVGWAGIAAMVLGLVLVLASQAAMGSSWRIGVDEAEHTALITTGIFAVVRNPVFTAMAVLMAGMVAAVPTWPSAAALAALITAVQIQVRAIEEPYLLRAHPTGYSAYAGRTGRFLPGIGRLKETDTAAENPR